MRRLLVVLVCVLALAPSAQARTSMESRGARQAICSTFGRYCAQAIRVASCESHLYVYARNGQYLGMFQMGTYARARYGHSWDVWGQARAAYRYFLSSGWSPWSCHP
jgi:hypothetical protein